MLADMSQPMKHGRVPAAMAMTLLATLALGLPGCAWKGADGIAPGVLTPAWRLQPVTMRVYPSSRIVREANQTLLEARIELLDEVGDSIKGVGDWRFDLSDPGRATDGATPQRLYTWEVAMLSRDQNTQFYDPVTRTYHFRLKLDQGAPDDHPLRLDVTFMPPDRQRMDARAMVSVEGAR